MKCIPQFIAVIFTILTLAISPAPAGAQLPPATSPSSATDVGAKPSTDTTSSAIANTTAPTTPGNDGIPVGTVITMQNWQQYRQFMSDGLVDLFSGKYYWKMPTDVSMPVGPTVVNPLPKNYLEATEKYSGQVKVVERPDGGLSLDGYHGGLPFPNPQEPHKGWKILANVWYRYIPHLSYISNGGGCTLNSTGNINCSTGNVVYRQLSYNTDPGTTNTVDPQGRFYTEWFMILSRNRIAILRRSPSPTTTSRAGRIFMRLFHPCGVIRQCRRWRAAGKRQAWISTRMTTARGSIPILPSSTWSTPAKERSCR